MIDGCAGPAYMSYDGVVMDAAGAVCDMGCEHVLTSEVLCVRCPSPTTAARMATLIRCVKHEKVSVLRTVCHIV